MKCSKCKYEWDTASKLMTVSCPSCGHKVDNPNTDYGKDRGDKYDKENKNQRRGIHEND